MSVEPEQIQPTYSGFLITHLHKISAAWDEGDPHLALTRTMKLVYFLPTDFKKALFPRISGHGFFTNQQMRNKAMTEVSRQRLPQFLDEVVELLDKRGYLEKRRREVPEGKE